MATIQSVSAASTRALEVVRRAGVEHWVHSYAAPERLGRERATRPAYGLAAAAALGVESGRLYKTLVVAVDDRLVLAVVPVAGELDLKRLAEALGGRRAELAEPRAAERATGYVVGAISPVGTRRRLPVVIDAGAASHTTIFVSAGQRGLQLELRPADLVDLTSAIQAQIARDL